MTGPRVIVRPGWRATLVEIATGKGQGAVPGLIHDGAPGLALTKALGRKKRYGITHLRSGRLVWPVGYDSFIEVRQLAEHLMLDLGKRDVDWSASFETLTADMSVYRAVCRSVYRVLGFRV